MKIMIKSFWHLLCRFVLLSEKDYRQWLKETGEIPEVDIDELMDYIVKYTKLDRKTVNKVIHAEEVFLRESGIMD